MTFEWLIMATFALLALGLAGAFLLHGWQGWLALKNRELDLRGAPSTHGMNDTAPTAARIELADLKERIRRLEAIAAGIDP